MDEIKFVQLFPDMFFVIKEENNIALSKILFQDEKIQVTCSFVAIYVPKETMLDCDNKKVLSIRDEILKQADTELYRAKNDNRNNIKLKQLTLF